MLISAALAYIGAVNAAATGPSYHKADLEKKTTAELASEMLLPDLAAVVRTHKLSPGLYSEDNYSGVQFLTGPRKVGGNFCARRRIYVSLHAVEGANEQKPRTDALVRPTNLNFFEQIALAPECEGSFTYANLRSVDITMGMELISLLDNLRHQARNGADLPMKVSCATELKDDSCNAGAIARLASLKLEQVLIIERPSKLEGSRWKWRISIPEKPGVVGPYAEINLDGDPTCVTEIQIHRKLPAPF